MAATDLRAAVMGLGDHRLRVLNVGATSPAVEKYESPRASIAGLVTSPDNRHALAQYGDGSATVRDLESGATVIEPYEALMRR